MDGGYQIIDILLFAGIAGFLVFRLSSVLGRRTGLEQRRNLFAPPQAPPSAPPAAAAPQPAAPQLRAIDGGATPPASALAALKAADSSFTEQVVPEGRARRLRDHR